MMAGKYPLRPRSCTIKKWPDFQGYGFNLHAERGRAGQYIGKVDDDSPAQAAGMKEGDRIVEVNGVNIGNENHSQVVNRIKASGEGVTMLLVDAETDKHYKDQKIVVASDMSDVVHLETPPRPGTEDDNDKDSSVKVDDEDGGADKGEDSDENQGKDVDSDSVNADKDSAGIPEASVDLEDQKQDYEERNDDDTPPPPPDSEPPVDDEPPSYNEVQEDERSPSPEPEPEAEPEPEPEVEPEPDRIPTPEPVPVVSSDLPSHNYFPRLCYIKKWADFQGYGFNLHAEKEKKGQFIGLVDESSPAEAAELKKGDRIIEVNGDNIENESHQQVIQKIKAGGDETKLLVVDDEADEYYQNNGIQITSSLPEVKFCETPEREAPAMTYTPRLCHIVKWPDFSGYGFNLHAEKERGAQYIGKIDDNSPAQAAGMREKDRIIEVNGVNIENETHQQVIGRIKSGGDESKLLLVDQEADNYYKGRGITVTSSMPEVKYISAGRRSAPAVTNGDSSPAPQPTRVEPAVTKAPPQANGGGDLMLNLTAKEMRERLSSKKRNDPKLKSNMDFKSKYDIFQKM